MGGRGREKEEGGSEGEGRPAPRLRLGSLQVSLGRRQAWSRAPRDQLPARLARPEGADPSHAGAGRVGRGVGAARARERREARSPGGGRALPAPLRLSPACARARARARARRAAAPLAGQGHHARSRVAWTSRLAAAGHAAGPEPAIKKEQRPNSSRAHLSLSGPRRARVCVARVERLGRRWFCYCLVATVRRLVVCVCCRGRGGVRERGSAGARGALGEGVVRGARRWAQGAAPLTYAAHTQRPPPPFPSAPRRDDRAPQ